MAIGETYAIEVISTTGRWTATEYPTYTGGSSYYYNTEVSTNDWTAIDYASHFATYVGTRENVPVPATALLVGPLLAVGAVVRHRRKQASR